MLPSLDVAVVGVEKLVEEQHVEEQYGGCLLSTRSLTLLPTES